MANSDSNSVDSSISQALNTLFDIRALAAGANGILELKSSAENAADAYRLTRLIISKTETAIAQINQADAARMAQNGGAA